MERIASNTQPAHRHTCAGVCDQWIKPNYMAATRLRALTRWHPSIPCGALACATRPTCNQVRQWLSEIALATLSWVWWETGLILWWSQDLPRFRRGEEWTCDAFFNTLRASPGTRVFSVCMRVGGGETRKCRQMHKGAVITPHLQDVRMGFCV